MDYVSQVSELNYMAQVVIMLYEDPTKDPSSEQRFHVELHFSPGVNCCVQKNLPPGPGFRTHHRNESVMNQRYAENKECIRNCSYIGFSFSPRVIALRLLSEAPTTLLIHLLVWLIVTELKRRMTYCQSLLIKLTTQS